MFAWSLIQGVSRREAVALSAACLVISVVAVTVSNYRKRRQPFDNVQAAALAGADLVVRGDRGVRARRLADGSVVAAPAAVPDSPDDEMQLRDAVTYGGATARLWLTGEHRRALHGLQPQPATAPEFVDGELMVTRTIAAREEGAPILVRHRRSLAPDADHLLTSLALDGTTRWTASFPMLGLARAAYLFADPARVVLVTSSRQAGCEAIALDAATGRVAWRSRL